jgi:MFS family permease
MSNGTAAGLRDVLDGGGGRLLVATLIQSFGQGAALACSTVYFVTVVGLTPGQVGFTYSVGTLVSMALAVVVGQLTDRWGARNVAVWFGLAAALAVASFTVVFDLIGFVLVQLLSSSLRLGKQIGENALVGRLIDARSTFRAYQRSVLNMGMSLGTLTAAVPLYFNDRAGYLAVMLANAAALTVGSLLLRRIPDSAGQAGRRPRADWRALRDLRYVGVGLSAGLMGVRDSVLTMALPLWLINTMHGPRPLAAILLFLNTAMVILLQVWASRGAEGARGAAAVVRRGGVALAVSCAVIGVAPNLPGGWAVAVVFGAIVCFTFGEMWTAAGSWTLSYELADPAAHGQYQGVFGMASQLGFLVGPVVATVVALPFGVWGWVAIGAGFTLTGVLCEQIVRSAKTAGRAHPVPATTEMGT